jgi:leader peptidase (prepilin peptidase)/N-methyltransferase
VEFCFGALWLIAGWRSGFELPSLIPGLLLLSGLLIAAFTDLDCRLIPNEITLTLMIGGSVLSFWNPLLGEAGFGRIANSMGGLAWGGGLLWGAGVLGRRLWKKDAMGGGDIKLAAGMGAFLGWKGTAIAMVAASFLGAIYGISLILAGKIKRRDYIPFGPFLSLGGIVVWLWPNLK